MSASSPLTMSKKRESYCERPMLSTEGVQVRAKLKSTKRPKSTFAPFFNPANSPFNNNNNNNPAAFHQPPCNASAYILPNTNGLLTTSNISPPMSSAPLYKYISNKNEKYYFNGRDELAAAQGFASSRPHGSTIANFYSHGSAVAVGVTTSSSGSSMSNNGFTSTQQLFAKNALKTSASCNGYYGSHNNEHVQQLQQHPHPSPQFITDPIGFFNSNSTYYKNRIFNRHR
jgi:hypothetical protein